MYYHTDSWHAETEYTKISIKLINLILVGIQQYLSHKKTKPLPFSRKRSHSDIKLSIDWVIVGDDNGLL